MICALDGQQYYTDINFNILLNELLKREREKEKVYKLCATLRHAHSAPARTYEDGLFVYGHLRLFCKLTSSTIASTAEAVAFNRIVAHL